ncbi:MAG: ferrous iron transport protein A [Fibrobacterales bacterium]
MKLNDLEIGKQATITEITATDELRHRLFSFGIRPGNTVEMKNVSFNHANLQVMIQSSLTNLRAEEAVMVIIEELK